MEFLLTPNNINAFARRQGNKLPLKQGNNFTFDGDKPIEFEDEHTTLHFFFPKDYAHAVADSVTGFANRLGIKRVFYSQGGKNFMLVGVPLNWINSAPAGDLIIDPTTTVTNSDDTYLQDATNFGTNTSLVIGKSSGSFKKRTIIKFNISGVPSYATVLNAQMKLRYYGTSGSTWIDRWVQAHQLLRHWREMEADSLKRRVGSNWLTPRGKIGPGSDSTLVDANGQYESTLLFKDLEYPAWKSWDLTALTQKWINSTATNYGVILWATNEDVNGMNLFFRSSEYTTDPTMQPKLEVIWSQLPRTVYFLKDHLGSIRATVQDTSTAPVCGYDDYDPWGYILAGRSVNSVCGPTTTVTRNKFTARSGMMSLG